MSRFTITAALAALSLLAPGAALAQQSFSEAIARDGRIVLPFEIEMVYPMIQGDVDGTAGRFMFDTGTPYSLLLNHHFIPLTGGREIARTATGSGQKVVVLQQDCIASIDVSPAYRLSNYCDARAADFEFLEKGVEPRFLGFIGHGLIKAYRITLDYKKSQVVLDDRREPLAVGALVTFKFKPENRHIPRVLLSDAGVSMEANFDTGNPGGVTLTEADAQVLRSAGKLVKSNLTPADPEDGEIYVVKDLTYETFTFDLIDVPVRIGAEKSEVALGHRFLKNYRSIWDYDDLTIHLYRP